MKHLFSKISVKEKEKLLRLLETNTLSFPKNTTILSSTKDNVIGIILEGHAQITRTDYNGNRTIIEELNE